MAKPEEYGISVRLVREDGEDMYEGRVQELPDVRTYGETYADAYLAAVEVIRTTQEIFAEKGRQFPEVELPEDEFSGRVTLRMSKSLHRAVHEKAQRDSVSLNQWVVEAVSARVTAPALPGAVYVISPMRHAQTGVQQYCVQQAQHVISGVSVVGSSFTLLATAAVVEGGVAASALSQNYIRARQ